MYVYMLLLLLISPPGHREGALLPGRATRKRTSTAPPTHTYPNLPHQADVATLVCVCGNGTLRPSCPFPSCMCVRGIMHITSHAAKGLARNRELWLAWLGGGIVFTTPFVVFSPWAAKGGPESRSCAQAARSVPRAEESVGGVCPEVAMADPRLLASLDLMRRMPPSRMEASLEGALGADASPRHHRPRGLHDGPDARAAAVHCAQSWSTWRPTSPMTSSTLSTSPCKSPRMRRRTSTSSATTTATGTRIGAPPP
jgi:hypothetical protein